MSHDDPIRLCMAGRIAPNVALARLILAGLCPEDIARRLEGQNGLEAAAMRRLLSARRDTLADLARAAREVDHTASGQAALTSLRDGFDRAARLAPEASVAFYTLGDPELMAAATAEIVDWLGANHLLGTTCDVLDLGCGIGRVADALAPHVRSVLGLDVAPEMVRQARARHGHDPRLRFVLTDGRGCGPEHCVASVTPAFDLLLAVDSFPYLVQAGVAERHMADAARILRPGGALVILNLSYRGLARDRDDARRWAARFGFRQTCDGLQPFKLWDGHAFVLRRRALRAAS